MDPKTKKIISLITVVVIVIVAVYAIVMAPKGEQLVKLKFETAKKVYRMGENITIFVNTSKTSAHYQISVGAIYPNGAALYGIGIYWIAPKYSPHKLLSELISSPDNFSFYSEYHYYIPFVINNTKTHYRFIWNQTITIRDKFYRAPAGWYLLKLQGYQWDNGIWNVTFKEIYTEKSLFYIEGLNYTLENSTLIINTTSPMNFRGSVELVNSLGNITQIPFNYTGTGIIINFYRYPEITSVKRDYVVYLNTSYGKYLVGSYESPGS